MVMFRAESQRKCAPTATVGTWSIVQRDQFRTCILTRLGRSPGSPGPAWTCHLTRLGTRAAAQTCQVTRLGGTGGSGAAAQTCQVTGSELVVSWSIRQVPTVHHASLTLGGCRPLPMHCADEHQRYDPNIDEKLLPAGARDWPWPPVPVPPLP